MRKCMIKVSRKKNARIKKYQDWVKKDKPDNEHDARIGLMKKRRSSRRHH